MSMSYEKVDLPALAARLVSARKAARITQEAAADHLGMSRPTFIAIEKASRRARPEELVKLARLYNTALNKLLRDDTAPLPFYPHLRSAIGDLSNYQDEVEPAMAQLSEYVDDYRYLEGLVGVTATTHFPPVVRMTAGSIDRFAEHCAEEERARLNLGAHQPVHAPRTLLEEAGLHVFVDKLDLKLAGLYAFVPNFGYCILVNSLHSEPRRRWTIAHEFAHFLVDRDHPGIDYLKPSQRRSENERFADAFAAAFLMPQTGVQHFFYEEIERTGDFKVVDLWRLADRYGVSMMVMSARLEALGLIARASLSGLRSQPGSSCAVREAPVPVIARVQDSIEPYPQRFKLLAVQAYVEDKLTEGQLMKLLRVSRIEARAIVDECSQAIDDSDAMQPAVPLHLTQSLLSRSHG